MGNNNSWCLRPRKRGPSRPSVNSGAKTLESTVVSSPLKGVVSKLSRPCSSYIDFWRGGCEEKLRWLWWLKVQLKEFQALLLVLGGVGVVGIELSPLLAVTLQIICKREEMSVRKSWDIIQNKQACSWPNNKAIPLFKRLVYFPQQRSGAVKVALFTQSRFKTYVLVQQTLTCFHYLAVTFTQASTS